MTDPEWFPTTEAKPEEMTPSKWASLLWRSGVSREDIEQHRLMVVTNVDAPVVIGTEEWTLLIPEKFQHSLRAEIRPALLEELDKRKDVPRGQVCRDCGAEHNYPEMYMVKDPVWAQAGLEEHDGLLCIECIEKRVGRQLKPDDFTDALINRPLLKSDRLQWRLTPR